MTVKALFPQEAFQSAEELRQGMPQPFFAAVFTGAGIKHHIGAERAGGNQLPGDCQQAFCPDGGEGLLLAATEGNSLLQADLFRQTPSLFRRGCSKLFDW